MFLFYHALCPSEQRRAPVGPRGPGALGAGLPRPAAVGLLSALLGRALSCFVGAHEAGAGRVVGTGSARWRSPALARPRRGPRAVLNWSG